MNKDELQSAPGLTKNNWPTLNDPAFGAPAGAEHHQARGSSKDSSSAQSSAETSKSKESEDSSAKKEDANSDKSKEP